MSAAPTGPLAGVRILEMEAIGPVPHAAMLLADLGATVLRVVRPGKAVVAEDRLARGREIVAADLKRPEAIELVLGLIAEADIVLEGFRPGVMERLGLGPEVCLARNPKLIYGRMTGWGQDGPLADKAGHDINYLAVAGLLHGFRRAGERPVPPVNLVGDFGGGALYLAMGVLAALHHAGASGQGQVIDAAMVDGAASLATMSWSLAGRGMWDLDEPGTNLLDTGAPFYEVYECADGEHVAVGAVEPQFYAALVAGLGLDAAELPHQNDASCWPELKARFAQIFATRTREEWCEVFAEVDACFAPVLSPTEALAHPHIAGRGTYTTEHGGPVPTPAPAPRLSVTPAAFRELPRAAAPATLAAWGCDGSTLADALERGLLHLPDPTSAGAN